MSITTYAELKTAMQNWPDRPDTAYTNRVAEFIALGEAMLFTDLRVREMEAQATITTADSTQTDSLPTRFVQARDLYISGTPYVRLEYRTPSEFFSVYASFANAKPAYYTIIGENFVWAPTPDGVYSIVVDHYARPAAFSADGDNNSVLTRWPNLYLYASLVHASPWIEDDAYLTKFTAMYESQVKQAHDADARDRMSGDAIPANREAQQT